MNIFFVKGMLRPKTPVMHNIKIKYFALIRVECITKIHLMINTNEISKKSVVHRKLILVTFENQTVVFSRVS
jgi:hypothetical protein